MRSREDPPREEAPAVAPPGAGHERPEGAGAAFASMLEAATAPVRAVAGPLGRGVGRIAEGAQRSIREGRGAQVRAVRRRGRQPLLNLFREHPRAYQATRRDLGLRTIAVDHVRGTAVEGHAQRGGDFLPLRQLRGQDWQNRWQRIRSALESLIDLPPIDVLKFGDEYWVLDGHNRLAAALYNGQVAIDANVTELAVPGIATEPPQPMAAFLQGSRDLRAAGEGNFTRTARLPADRDQLPDAIAAGDEAGDATERPHAHGHARTSDGQRGP